MSTYKRRDTSEERRIIPHKDRQRHKRLFLAACSAFPLKALSSILRSFHIFLHSSFLTTSHAALPRCNATNRCLYRDARAVGQSVGNRDIV